MMGSKRRASRDMARMDGKHFSLDSVLTVLSFLILVVVVVIPMVMIVCNTFFYEGKFDTSLFTQIILDPGNVAAMWNTIKIALLVTLFGTIIGLFFAWLLGRSDIPLKGLMRSMFTIPYMFPPFFGAMAWELLLSPRSGYLNKWLMATFGLSKAPFNINSIGGIIFVECSYYFPFVFMQVVSALERMDIADIAQATIRQSGDIARVMETQTGMEFLHLEMGVPGLPPEKAGVEAECRALQSGVASQYPNMFGIPELKQQTSRFIRAFLDVGVAPQGCIPTVGSMQGSFTAFLLCSQLAPGKDTILFIDPGFPVQRNQVQILDIPSASFDIYEYRAEKLGPKLESYLAQGNIAAIVYSNPNNPAWICLTEDELRTIGELATRYDAIVIEDLAYLCMDFRKPLGRPFEAPYQATVARYTDNYILMISGSKIFSYAGQRIAIAAISDKLYPRHYPALKQRYGMGRLGDAYVLTFLYAASSGTSHSAQHALAAMFRAAADGQLDFVGETSEYARRARLTKEIFQRHGFRIVYDKDQDETVSDGFFYTVGYGGLSSAELLSELLLYGICAISLTSTGSRQPGIRVCVSQLNRPEQFELLETRLTAFGQNHR